MTNLIIDFDSTIIKNEGLEELAEITLRNSENRSEVVKKIEEITNLGMEGNISFRESLERRLAMLSITKQEITALGEKLKKDISKSVMKNKEFFKKNRDSIYIISGGFKDFILLVIKDLGIREDHVIANTFVYDEDGRVIGFDEDNPLSNAKGKVNALKKIDIQGERIAIGDGWTDYEMKEAGIAQKFYAYCENVKREKVCEVADKVVYSFDEIV